MIGNDIILSIEQTINSLISMGLCIDQNYPFLKQIENDKYEVSSSPVPPLSIGKTDYDELFQYCIKQRLFSIMLVDGGLLQLNYICLNDEIISHRLAYLPCRDIYRFDDWHDEYYEGDLFLDVVSSKVSVVPLRMDYDPDAFVPNHHPKSHVHLGFHKDCRIPINKPVEPSVFCEFIVKHFYNTAYVKSVSKNMIFDKIKINQQETIHDTERDHLFFCI